MSKLYDRYLEEKNKNPEILYLFKSGMFYIFIDEDAIKISSITTLKLINLTKDIVKCGFPEKTFQKYLNIFENLNLKIKIIENENSNTEFESLINKIKKININEITPLDALKILSNLKESINE